MIHNGQLSTCSSCHCSNVAKCTVLGRSRESCVILTVIPICFVSGVGWIGLMIKYNDVFFCWLGFGSMGFHCFQFPVSTVAPERDKFIL